MVSLIQIKLFKHIFIFEDGIVIGCDVSEDFTNLAKKYWTEAGVDKKIKLEIAPAADTLNKLVDNGEENTFDFAFIDADKVIKNV